MTLSTDKYQESGFTIVELIIAAAMMVVITGAAIAMLTSALRQQPELSERAHQVGLANVAMEGMLREIRQGVLGTVGGTATELSLETYVDGKCGATPVTTATRCGVKFVCGSGKCTRTTGGTGAARTIVSGLANVDVFTFTKGASPCANAPGEPYTYVGVSLELRTEDGSSTQLQDGANPRSCP